MVFMGEEFGTGLADWFWFGVSHEVVVTSWPGLHSPAGFTRAKVYLLAMWSNHVTGRLMLAMARVLNSSSSSLSMGHFICGCLVSNPRDQGGSSNTFYNLRSHF